jgi:FAD/FMN-containing dehydrogenase
MVGYKLFTPAPSRRPDMGEIALSGAVGVAGAAALGFAAALTRTRRRRGERRSALSELLPAEAWAREHARKVERIATALRERKSTRPLSLRKRAPSHEVPKADDLRRRDEKIDISDLDAILEIDEAARTCTAEAGVTFVDLVAATMRYGLVPLVVPELKTITVGGAVSGCSIESTSFRYGGFHDTCLEYEVVTAKGEILVCTPENENALVFQMIHGSFGTLGILTRLKFRLMPAKRYVNVVYEKYRALRDFQAAVNGHFVRRDVDFLDGMIHSPTEYVLSCGRFVDEAPYANRYDWLKVYYRSTRERAEDYLRTADYFFRYDRGVTNVRPRSFLGRLFFGKLLSSTTLLTIAERAPWLLRARKPSMTLDVFLPFSKVPAFLAWYEGEFGFYPLWCVPYRRVRDYEWVNPRIFDGLKDELFFDLAIYGMKQPPGKNCHRIMEKKLRELGGIKTLIDLNYYPEDEFWETWNKVNYDAVKARTDPDNVLRDLYTKTCRTARGVA